MKIPLTNGMFAIIDDEDFDLVKNYKWYAHKRHNTYSPRSRERKTFRLIYMHNLLLGRKFVDHVNGNGLDNRRENLRLCNRSQNRVNSVKSKNKSSKYKGVSWRKKDKRWRSAITFNGRVLYLGSFKKEIDAGKAYDSKAIELFGEFARPNIGVSK